MLVLFLWSQDLLAEFYSLSNKHRGTPKPSIISLENETPKENIYSLTALRTVCFLKRESYVRKSTKFLPLTVLIIINTRGP